MEGEQTGWVIQQNVRNEAVQRISGTDFVKDKPWHIPSQISQIWSSRTRKRGISGMDFVKDKP